MAANSPDGKLNLLKKIMRLTNVDNDKIKSDKYKFAIEPQGVCRCQCQYVETKAYKEIIEITTYYLGGG